MNKTQHQHTHIYFLTHIYMRSKNVVQLHEVNTHTKESIKTTRSKCGGLFVRILFGTLAGLDVKNVKKTRGEGARQGQNPRGEGRTPYNAEISIKK